MRRVGFVRHCSDVEQLVVDLHIVLYLAHWGVRAASARCMPGGDTGGGRSDLMVEGDQFVVFFPYAALQTDAHYLLAVVAFFAWFKVIFYLSVVPQFALINFTMAKALPRVRSFVLVFGVVMYGFGEF